MRWAGLRQAFQAADVQRDQVVVCTKAGYLVPDAIPAELALDDVVGSMHSMAPSFLADQLERSQSNLELPTIDVFYLHNPETQLGPLGEEEFYKRIRLAFDYLENASGQGKIRYYGTATWDGFRRGPGAPQGLSLARLVKIAAEVAGDRHRFRFIQLPFNFAMTEAFAQRDAGKNVLARAVEYGITVVASASLLQARLVRGLPDQIAAKLPGMSTDAQRCVQFARSTPGITVALVGMSRVEHVQENAAVASIPPIPAEQYLDLYG